jgi:peptide chain release factor 1
VLQKLDSLEEKYEELGNMIGDPEVISDLGRWQQYVKAHADLADLVNTYRDFKKVVREIEEAKALLEEEDDSELLEMYQAELDELVEKKESLEQRLKVLLLPKDPNDEKNVILEIRAGTGGEEAALFAADLFRMYSRYAERQGWKTEILNANHTDIGGFKELICLIQGRGAYSRLKFESGVHRVQRIPTTESGGRIHTSAATVAVLPEAKKLTLKSTPMI